jgi:hypothetical protein
MTNTEKTTTWASLVPTLVSVAASAPQPQARAFALGQLVRLGQIVDEHIARLRELEKAPTRARDDGEDVCAECGVGAGEHAYGCPALGEDGCGSPAVTES